MVNSALYSSAKDDWETPQDLFDAIDVDYDFTLDVCATKENAKCEKYYTLEDDGLVQPWTGRCWCNPPYGRRIGLWLRKGFYTVENREAELVCYLLPARVDTRWFHDYVWGFDRPQGHVSRLEFLKGRLRFGGATNSAPFPSMVVVFGDRIR